MGEKKNVPELRFEGFTDTWEQCKLGDEAIEMVAGGDIDKSLLDEHGKYPVIANALTDNGIVGYYARDYRIKAPAVTVTGRGDVGHAKARTVDFTPVVRLLSVRSKHDVFFLENAINTLNIIIESTGVPQLTVPQLSHYEIFFPPTVDEEKEIGTFFDRIDSLLTLQQRKCERLKNIKKSMLEKMFPREGSDVPEIRFEGFSGAWERKQLGEVAQVTMGQSPDGSTYSETPSKYILVQGNADMKDGWVIPRMWTTQKTKTANAGDLIMSVRAPAGAMGKTAYDVVLGRGVAGIKGNEFLFQSLLRLDKIGYWKKLAAGSTFESINAADVNNAEIIMPRELDEQNIIGDYFRNLDHLITLHQQKYEKLKQLKQSLLEKMFV